MKPSIRLALAGLVAASLGAYSPAAHAQRGGGGRPGPGHRGGGGYLPGPGSHPSFSSSLNRTPTYTPGLVSQPRYVAPATVQPAAVAPVVVAPVVAAPVVAAPTPAPAVRTGGIPPAWASRPGWSNHQGWIHGYWHGRNNAAGGWGLNPSVYDWGYRPFANPYAVADQSGHDYSRPFREVEPAADAVSRALRTFDAARAAFKAGHYDSALQMTDAALKDMPDDAAVHEFRALCLFALRMYDQAAPVLYAVLASGPGWDWTTLAGLYPDIDVYAGQLRALEAYRTANPNSAAARFVLGYQYLTEGFRDSAAREFKKAAELQPADSLSARIVANLTGDTAHAERALPAAPATAPADDALLGVWKAAPDAATAIELTLQDGGGFIWNVTREGRIQPIVGTFTHVGDVLTLARAGAVGDSIIGRAVRKGPNHFTFQALGGGADDPGLDFTK